MADRRSTPSRPPTRRHRRLGAALAAVAVAALAIGLPAAAGPGRVEPASAPIGRQAGDDPQLPVNPDADPERARRTAGEILEGSEYRAPEASDRSALDRLREWIADRLPDLSGAGEGATDVVSLVVVGVVVVGALAGITWLLATSRRARAAPDEADDAAVTVSPLRSPDEWADEAERCARDGDHRGAVRARFRVLTTTLARRDLVADTPGRTAGELRADVAARAPALVPSFGAAADHFERAWFGAEPVGPADAATALQLTERALAAAPRRPPDPAPPAGAGAPAGSPR